MKTNRHNGFINLFKAIHPLSFAAKDYLKHKTVISTYKKGEIICEENTNFKKMVYIKKGIVRGFFNHKDKEITSWICFDNELFTSISGFFANEPAREKIQAIEDTVVEHITLDDFNKGVKLFEESIFIYKALLEKYYVSAENRAYMARIPLAKDRFEYYIKDIDPAIVNRIPKKYLANFLNMQPETLTRITSNQKKLEVNKIDF